MKGIPQGRYTKEFREEAVKLVTEEKISLPEASRRLFLPPSTLATWVKAFKAGKLEALRAKMERLGMAFADGAIEESTYKSKLKQLKKQEANLLKCRQNIDPLDMDELEALQGRIAFIKEVLSRGKLEVTEFGLFGKLFDEEIYVPAGFNAWRESDGELAIGEVTEMDYFQIEGTDKYMRGIDVPPGFWECGDHETQSRIIKKNMRAILQLFGIKVLVYPDRVEIKGTIPSQVLYQGEKPEPETGLVITSPSP